MKAKRANTTLSWPQLEQFLVQNSLYLDAWRHQSASAILQRLYHQQQMQQPPTATPYPPTTTANPAMLLNPLAATGQLNPGLNSSACSDADPSLAMERESVMGNGGAKAEVSDQAIEKNVIPP